MIVSASRRTDIPAFYSEWLMNRLREGCVIVPNPYNARRAARVALDRDSVDAIVFWTKDAKPMLSRLDELDGMGYRYAFQYTVTGYGRDVERNVPPVEARADTFLRLSERLGPERVDWRFDPILLDGAHDVRWQVEAFSRLANRLAGATTRCVISFVDSYRRARARELTEAEMRDTARALHAVAAPLNLPLYACAEPLDLSDCGVRPSRCIDGARMEALAGHPLRLPKDGGQRPACGCAKSVDIGAYDTCEHGCVYCYATGKARAARAHDPLAPMLTGYPAEGVEVTDSPARPRGT